VVVGVAAVGVELELPIPQGWSEELSAILIIVCKSSDNTTKDNLSGTYHICC
jgi:hypothetical protein